MATLVLTDAKVWLGEYNISSDLNQLGVTVAADALEDTAFGATFHTSKAGLRKASVNFDGYQQWGSTTTTIDGRVTAKFASATDTPMTFAAEGGDAGEMAMFGKFLVPVFNQQGSVGELMKIHVEASSSGTNSQLVKGTIFEDSKTSRTTASNTSTVTLGAVTSSQKVYANIHVTAFSGTNVTFTLKSAVTNWGTPSTRATSATYTGVGSEYITPVAGAITDTFWRFEWTGTFTSFSAVLVAGIQ